jgi:myo-inositol 2-dehydrogenase/D-chiro-inositol 1-dehydrogenase
MNRRSFLKSTSALSTITFLKPELVFGTNRNSSVRFGVIGSGSRSKGILEGMRGNKNVQVTAIADLFKDKLDEGIVVANNLNKANGYSNVPNANTFYGVDAYLKLLSSKDVDAVVISSPGYTHPKFLEEAIKANKHVYCEKPSAVDAYGCVKIIGLGAELRNRLSAFNGFQIRYATPYVEMVKRVKRGDIGDIVSVQLYYFSSGPKVVPHEGMSYDEMRVRNHYLFHEMSGGCYLDQAIHMIDVCNWALDATPLYAFGMGGSKGGLDLGNAWTNYQVLYKYPNDINVSVQSAKFGNVFGDVCARFVGTKGIAEAHYSGGVFINGEKEWDSGVVRSASEMTPESIAQGSTSSSLDDADSNKVNAFIDSIISGNYINQIDWGSKSTLTAILGREAAQRQDKVSWDELIYNPQKVDPQVGFGDF